MMFSWLGISFNVLGEVFLFFQELYSRGIFDAFKAYMQDKSIPGLWFHIFSCKGFA